MNELIRQARELCEKATPGPWEFCESGNTVKSHMVITRSPRKCITGGISPKTNNSAFIAASRTLVPQLCDALEAAQKDLIDYHHTQKVADGKTAENARLRRINEQLAARAEKAEANAGHLVNQAEEYKHKFNAALVRAEKVEAEISVLRTPKQAVAIKMDTVVQIGHVRFGRGCTVHKCPCCGTFLTPTHKYCLECGQAVSFPNSTEEE